MGNCGTRSSENDLSCRNYFLFHVAIRLIDKIHLVRFSAFVCTNYVANKWIELTRELKCITKHIQSTMSEADERS